MKLKQVEIKNFRCFERLTVTLEDDVTAIIGVNAAGKTALLDAIAAALSPLLEGTEQRTGNGAVFWASQSRSEKWGVSLRDSDVHMVSDADESSREPLEGRTLTVTARAQRSEASRDGDYPPLSWQHQWTRGGVIMAGVPYRISWLEPEGLAPAALGLRAPGKGQGAGVYISIPALAYYRDNRNCGADDQKKTDQDSAFYSAFDAYRNFDATQKWFFLRSYQELLNAKRHGDISLPDPVLSAIRAGIKQLIGGIEEVFADGDPPRIKAVQKAANGEDVTVFFAQLSAGQRGLIAMLVDFARRLALTWPAWDNPLEAPGILLIDEIELNLHPKWQQTVIPHLRKVFPNTQIIVATHSPIVLSTLESRQIRILRGQQIFVPSIETYGTASDRVQRQVMDTETTPPENAFAQDVDQLYQQIDEDNLDAAEVLLARLEDDRGTAEPTLIRARMLIANRRWEAELGL